IFRREPTFKIPEKGSGVGRALSDFLKDANMLGSSLPSYAKDVVREVIGVGRAGTLVDWESGSATGEHVERRAYAVLYQTEQIINWRTERVNGRNVLSLVVLKEQGNVAHPTSNAEYPSEEFQNESVEQIRVLRLVKGNDAGWFYQVEI